jgi:hypothetical protein
MICVMLCYVEPEFFNFYTHWKIENVKNAYVILPWLSKPNVSLAASLFEVLDQRLSNYIEH